MNEVSLQAIMQNNPQQWTINSILSQQYGKIILRDNERACLNTAQFYYIEGPFLLSFAQALLKEMHLSGVITSSNQDWYRYFMNTKPNHFQLLPRRMYKWTNQINKLLSYTDKPSLYQVKPINQLYANEIEKLEWAQGVFDSYVDMSDFLKHGFGYCVLDGEKIVALCMSFSQSSHGVEIEVDTDPKYQGQGIGKIVSARFVAEAYRRNMTSLWDATNIASAKIAEALGFEFVREYIALCRVE